MSHGDVYFVVLRRLRYPPSSPLEDTVLSFIRRACLWSIAGLVAIQAFAQSSVQSPAPNPTARQSSPRAAQDRKKASPSTAKSNVQAPQPGALAQVDPNLLKPLHWRSIGPFRGGRTRAIAGVPSQPSVFYIGVCNGGVWKTDDYGRTWKPIFDDQPTGSIGSVAVAASDPNIVYVGSGEGLHRPDLSVGDGIYKSTDAGKTWTHLGLRDGQQIPQLAIDPHDPNKVFAAVAGHPYGPNKERGVYRSTDGGQNWQQVLGKDENVGASDVLIDPSDSNIVYATLWEAREGAWENGAWNGTGGGLFKSTDGGTTFQQLAGGLPEGVVQSHVAIADSNPKILMATVGTKDGVKIYRSEDAGASWAVITSDSRPAGRIGGGDLSVPRFDPKDPNVVYVASTVTWKSADGGKTWKGFRGAPGGDDYQNVWVNPNDTHIIILASDQGAIVSVNGGESWSSWYNQPTAQMYHVNADNAFPYRVCSGQQESGSACIASRGNDGQITIREWHPVSAEEYGYVVPDPLDPDTIYGGKLTRYDRRTGQAQQIAPKAFRSQSFRVVRTEPIVFSPKDPHTLYFASNNLWKTTNGGQSWTQISPDLTRKDFAVPASIGKFSSEPTAKPTQRGVIYAVAPSPLDINRIWAGTDDGQIQITVDGGRKWANITPADMQPFQKISIIEASHFDPQTAYAAVNTLRLDDLRPHILRTRNGGKIWQEIVAGIPENENVNVVREDPLRRGLLFAGTERAVYVSFDDGDHWQSLRNDMAPSSVRDVIIKDDDLIAATHGRGFWIMDDITPLRQLQTKALSSDAYLFKPQTATRVRWSMNPDTPLPPDFPAGENPPDGAVINYYLQSAATSSMTLEIKDAAGKTVRSYSSSEKPEPIDPMLNIPTYWVRPPQTLSAAAGMHRFLWNMHYADIPGLDPEYPISAVPHNTVPQPSGAWALPGTYTVVLTVNGKSYSQPLTVRMDPRVKTPPAALQAQFSTSQEVSARLRTLAPAAMQAAELRKQLQERLKSAPAGSETATTITAFNEQMNSVLGAGGRRPGPANDQPTLAGLRTKYLALLGTLQEADDAPTTQTENGIAEVEQQFPQVMSKWQDMKDKQLPLLNEKLKAANLPEINLAEPDAHASASAQDKDEE
jgi:photosystem II stability/assembly factor-like uncharacterized protein